MNVIDIAGRPVLGVPLGEAQGEAADMMNAYASPQGATVLHGLRTDRGDLIDHLIVSGTHVVVVFSSRTKPRRRVRKDMSAQLVRRLGNVKISFVDVDRHTCERVCARVMRHHANESIVASLADLLTCPVRPTGLIAAGVPA